MAEMLTVENASMISGLGVTRIRQLAHDGIVQAIKTPHRSEHRREWRINKESLLHYMATRRPVGRPRKR